MGLKVPNGYKSTVMSLSQLAQCRTQLNEAVRKKVNELSNHVIMAKAIWLYDLNTMTLAKSSNPLMEAWSEMNDSKIDLIFGCSFYFNEYEDDLYFLYTGSLLHKAEFERIMGVTEYGYNGSFDRPQKYTEEEWTYRYEVWNHLIGSEKDELSMFYCNCYDGMIPIPKQQKITISFEDRVKGVWSHVLEKNPKIRDLQDYVASMLDKELTYDKLFDKWKEEVKNISNE